MASTRTYRWLAGDTIWFIAARYLAESGFSDVSTFVEAIRAANPQVLDWGDVGLSALVTLPYLTS